MTEHAFLDRIDCRFPYTDEEKWKALIGLGRTISTNAALAVLYEIGSPPKNTAVSPSSQQNMVTHWRTGFDHPLADALSEVALERIEGGRVPNERGFALMDAISRYPGQYAALSIVYFACADYNSGEVDRRLAEITAAWKGGSSI